MDNKEQRYENQKRGKAIELVGILLFGLSIFLPFIMESFWKGLFWGIISIISGTFLIGMGAFQDGWNRRH